MDRFNTRNTTAVFLYIYE